MRKLAHMPRQGEGSAPTSPDRWTSWLDQLERLAVEDPDDVLVELVDGLANAGFPALAEAVAQPCTTGLAMQGALHQSAEEACAAEIVRRMRPIPGALDNPSPDGTAV